MDLVDYRWMPWPSYLMSCTSPKIDASMSAIGDLTIWPHIPATQTSTLVTCTLFNMKFVLASTLPTDRGWCNYLCSPCLVVGWFPFDAPSAQWPFGGASRREPVHCLVHVERAFVASMLRTYLASTLANFNAFSSCSSLHRSSKRRGIDVAFVQVLWAMRFPHFLFFPKVEPIAALHGGVILGLFGRQSFAIIELLSRNLRPQTTHIFGIRTCLTLCSLIISPPKVAKDAVLMWRLFEYCGPCFSFSFKVTYLPLRCYCITTSRKLEYPNSGRLEGIR